MNNADYWTKRFAAIESENHKKAKMAAAEIAEVYKEAEMRLQKEIEVWYGRLAANNGVSMEEARRMMSKQELEEFRWDVKEYIKVLEDNETSGAWKKELENASARYHISRYEGMKIRLRQQVEAAAAEQEGIMQHHLRDVFGESYYKTAYEMQSGLLTGFAIATVNTNQIEAALKRPWAADGKAFSERIWSNRGQLMNRLDTEITRNIMLGRGVQESAAAIAKEFKTSVSRAATLVYTETAYVASEAQRQCFKELGVEQYEIVATLDNLTSEICQSMDGQHFLMKDFKPGVTAPPFHPNCRSVTVPYFDDEYSEIFEKGERAARDEDGKTVSVPEDMTYPEWKKVYVDKTMTLEEWKNAKNNSQNDVANSAESGIKDNVKYTDITQKYMDRSISDRGALNYSKPDTSHEVIVAKILHKIYGGNINVLEEVNPDGIKNPDYLWNGKFWELKGPKEETGINAALKQGLKQIKTNPGGVIIDVCEADNVSLESMKEKVIQRMKWTKKGTDIDIILMHKQKILCVMNYKKI